MLNKCRRDCQVNAVAQLSKDWRLLRQLRINLRKRIDELLTCRIPLAEVQLPSAKPKNKRKTISLLALLAAQLFRRRYGER